MMMTYCSCHVLLSTQRNYSHSQSTSEKHQPPSSDACINSPPYDYLMIHGVTTSSVVCLSSSMLTMRTASIYWHLRVITITHRCISLFSISLYKQLCPPLHVMVLHKIIKMTSSACLKNKLACIQLCLFSQLHSFMINFVILNYFRWHEGYYAFITTVL